MSRFMRDSQFLCLPRRQNLTHGDGHRFTNDPRQVMNSRRAPDTLPVGNSGLDKAGRRSEKILCSSGGLV